MVLGLVQVGELLQLVGREAEQPMVMLGVLVTHQQAEQAPPGKDLEVEIMQEVLWVVQEQAEVVLLGKAQINPAGNKTPEALVVVVQPVR